jgi:phage terminase large subunit-like protein
VLADRTCQLPPEGWARVAINAYREFRADRIVAETNYGGAMVVSTIHSVDRIVGGEGTFRVIEGGIKCCSPIALKLLS